MSAAGQEIAPLHFRGVPIALDALVPIAVQGRPPAVLRIKGEDAVSQALRVRQLGSTSRLRLSLPPQTPPGKYDGIVTLDHAQYLAVIEVEAFRRFDAIPGRFHFNVARGGSSVATLSITNRGNVRWPVPHVVAFGIFEEGGVESALAAVYHAPEVRGTDRIDLLGDELSARNALVRGTVTRDVEVLSPGETTTLTLTLTFPTKLRADKLYSGTWILPLSNLRLRITVEADDAQTPGPRRHAKPRKAV